ncbi:MAG: substrate-binding domain-containing protein [Flavobacteriaceae bacterium]
MDKKYTIKDIAKLAGVSKGTVDRVLHGRGKVSDEANQKIKQVLKEIDYHPNPIARNLKNNRIYRICVLLPDPNFDPYWIPANEGIDDAIIEFKPFGLMVEKFFYNTGQRNSFVEEADNAVRSAPDAILMAPVFHKESLQVFEKCQKKQIKVAFFNNYIDIFNTENFIGQDLTQSGRVAASLIDKMETGNSTIVILHIDEEAHMRQKENGFKEYFEEQKDVRHTLITYSLNSIDNEHFKKNIADFFEKHPTVSSIFVTNSKAYLLIDAIRGLSKNMIIIGYDLLEENIAYLENGKIDFLIHQKPKRQAYLGVVNLADYFLFGKPIQRRNLLPIDIITAENVKYYLEPVDKEKRSLNRH